MQSNILPPLFAGLLLLLCSLDSHTGPGCVGAIAVRPRCECPQTVDGVPWRLLKDFHVRHKNSLCYKVQIILILETGEEICLNPESKQGQRIQKCWTRIKKKPEKKRECWPN